MPATVGIVGGGLIGLATARQLALTLEGCTIVLFEKEARVGQHQSTHNSGVLHAGLYYRPGSFKARLAVRGIRMMTAYCRDHSVAHEICGKLVVATTEAEISRLRDLHQRGRENQLRDLRWLEPEGMRELEPEVGGLAALHVPEEGIVDFAGVCHALLAEIRATGVDVRPNTRFVTLRREGSRWLAATTNGDFSLDLLINCAGLQSDLVAQQCGLPRELQIVPFRGEYYHLKPERTGLVRNLIYPVPDPSFPFLGVHFTRLIGGGVEAGPNAVLALAREGYRPTSFHPREAWDALSYPGLWRFLLRHPAMCLKELATSVSRPKFAQALQRLVPNIKSEDLEPGGAGVRAQAMSREGFLAHDFHFVESANSIHVLNAPSPGATASLAVAEEIVNRALLVLGPVQKLHRRQQPL